MSESVGVVEQVASKHWECVTVAARDIFSETCATSLSPLPDGDSPKGNHICGAISLTGDIACSVFVALPPNTAVALAQAFAGFEIPFDSEDMDDTVGELANILVGRVKEELDKRGVAVEISLPNVQRGSGNLAPGGDAPAKQGSFQVDAGKLWLGMFTG